jgi:hypothetical protein
VTRTAPAAHAAAVVLAAFAPLAPASAQGTIPVYGAVEGGASIVLSNTDGRNVYSGVVRYQGRATCTGVFVRTARSDSEGERMPAYVLTNGHCADFPGSNQVLVDRPAGNHRVIFNYFADTIAAQRTVAVRRIAYATMKGLDIAVLELDGTFGDLIGEGFVPWRLAAWPGLAREPVVVVGAPQIGGAAGSFLRLAACRGEGAVPVLLEFVWHWFDGERNACADVRPGSSGSPVISRITGRVVAIVNTTTAGAAPYTDCYLDHPCEAGGGTVGSRPATNYASPVSSLVECFDTDGLFVLERPGCGLDPGVQLAVNPANIGGVNPDLTEVPIGQPRSRWNVAVTGSLPYYRHKVVAAGEGDCGRPIAYGEIRRVLDQPVIDDPLPRRDGPYLLCVIAGADSRGIDWQRARHATVVAAVVDHVPPRIAAPLTIEQQSGTSYRVVFNAVPYEISGYLYKFGRPADTRCSDEQGYQLVLIPFISISVAQGPQAFCAIPYDAAGNRAPPIERLLQ